MKKLILFAVSLFCFDATAQIKAVTEDGKEVILLDNKTWRFLNESDEKTLETITSNETPLEKDKNSTFLFRSKKIDAGLYINPKIWKTTDIFKAPYLEYTFITNENQQVVGMFTAENIEIATLKNLKDLQISLIEKRADYFKLKESEYRTVNGLKVLYLRYIANTKGMDFEFEGYFYLTSEGYCAVVAYSTQKYFEQLKPKMDIFINGLVKTEKAKTTEVYSLPPPPMPSSSKNKN